MTDDEAVIETAAQWIEVTSDNWAIPISRHGARKIAERLYTQGLLARPVTTADVPQECPHCDPGAHRDPNRVPWGVRVAPERDADGQPIALKVERTQGSHVAQSDADWLWQVIRDHQDWPVAPVADDPAQLPGLLTRMADVLDAVATIPTDLRRCADIARLTCRAVESPVDDAVPVTVRDLAETPELRCSCDSPGGEFPHHAWCELNHPLRRPS